VEVKVLYDDFGSATAHLSSLLTPAQDGFAPPSDMRKYLRSGSKVKVRLSLNPWLVADHTKLIVFDSRTAILGGMNIGREYYSEWHDLMVRVEGPVVASLEEEFMRSWRQCGPWGDFGMLARARKFSPTARREDDIPIRILKPESGHARHEIRDASLLAIRGAKNRIYIENPYFASDDIIFALRSALRKGVDVRVILPAEGDSAIMDAGNIATARALMEEGAKLYRYPKMAI
jgi:cardiolipin synthase|tara:strand:+ start:70164 stop:70859 length:696 start_codon:yes stop_codon:yes gene_type:complete